MGDWGIVIFVVAGAVIGCLYGVILVIKNKKKDSSE